MKAIWMETFVAENIETVETGGAIKPDAAWCHPLLWPGARQLTDRLVFWRGAQGVA